MKLSISNIGWGAEYDEIVYSMIKKYNFSGLEIAPTRVFTESPYERINQAIVWAEKLKEQYGFVISSMQSIWFGRKEKLFGTEKERNVLTDYTKKSIDFAAAVNCKNLVFGCPRNRFIPMGTDLELGISFFRIIGDYAAQRGTAIGMEANPPIYNTNYINDTIAALDLIESVNSSGFLLNLDVGTMIQNEESIDELRGKVKLINHVHISEPGLQPIERRELHLHLKDILSSEDYQGFISIEMRRNDNLQLIESTLNYVKEIFG